MSEKHLQYGDKGYACCFPACGQGRLVKGGDIASPEGFERAIQEGNACELCKQIHEQRKGSK